MNSKNLNHKLTGSGRLLNEKGFLREAGWANSLVYDYSRSMVKANKSRLKEWDYYHVIDSEGKYAVSFTFADNGYTVISAEVEMIPQNYVTLNEHQRETFEKMLAKLDESDDVQEVIHNLEED